MVPTLVDRPNGYSIDRRQLAAEPSPLDHDRGIPTGFSMDALFPGLLAKAHAAIACPDIKPIGAGCRLDRGT